MGWTNWMRVGGQAVGPPAIIDREGTQTVLVRGIDNHLWVRRGVDMHWEPWAIVDEVGKLTSGPSAQYWPRMKGILVAARGEDGFVWTRSLVGAHDPWMKVEGGNFDPAIAIVGEPSLSIGGGAPIIAARGQDDRLWWTGWSEHTSMMMGLPYGILPAFTGWHQADPDLRLFSPPALVRLPNGVQAYVAAQSPGQTSVSVWEKKPFATAGATQWQPGGFDLGGGLIGAPAVVHRGYPIDPQDPAPRSVDVFVRGTDSFLWQRPFRDGAWHDWLQLAADMKITSAPAADSGDPGSLHLVARGDDGGVWHKHWEGPPAD